MRKLIPIFFLLIWAQSARAQNFTTVTASNIQDVSGAKLASGMLCFDATNATNASNDTPSNEISFQAGGGGQVIRGPICTPITNGAIGTFQVPNSANTIPPGVAYHVYVVRGFYHVLDYYGVQVTGSTWSFDNYNPNSPTPAPPTGASVNGPLTVNGNLSVTGSLSLSSLALTTPLAVQYGGTGTSTPGLVAGSNISISGTWPNQTIATVSSPTFSAVYIAASGSNPSFAFYQGGGGFSLGVYGKDAAFFALPDLSTANPIVTMFSGSQLGANPVLKIQGSLQLTTPLAVAYGGTGTASPGLVAGSNISISGSWPNQTIATVSSPTFSAVSIAASGSNPSFSLYQGGGGFNLGVSGKDACFFALPDLSTANPVVTIFCGSQLGANPTLKINGSLQLTTPLAVAYGGTGTSSPSLVAGPGISITGTWPNQTISATGGGGGATSIQTSATDTTWAGIASTTLVSTSQNTGGVWRINVFAEVSAAGTACTTGDGTTTMSLTINYTDPYTNGTITLNSVVSLNLGSGNGTVGTSSTGTVITYPKSGTAITYSTSVTKNSTCSTPPQYTVALQAIH